MDTTSLTLLASFKPGAVPQWDRFDRLYMPLLRLWARKCGFSDADADDVAQQVFTKLLEALPQYNRATEGSFRSWLFVIARNCGHDFRRRKATRILPTPDGLSGVMQDSPLAELEEAEYLQELFRNGIEVIRPEFSEPAMAAFEGTKVQGRPAAAVGDELGMTANAVYVAVNRVMSRLRDVLTGLMD